jgi:hypothetical protein
MLSNISKNVAKMLIEKVDETNISEMLEEEKNVGPEKC